MTYETVEDLIAPFYSHPDVPEGECVLVTNHAQRSTESIQRKRLNIPREMFGLDKTLQNWTILGLVIEDHVVALV